MALIAFGTSIVPPASTSGSSSDCSARDYCRGLESKNTWKEMQDVPIAFLPIPILLPDVLCKLSKHIDGLYWLELPYSVRHEDSYRELCHNWFLWRTQGKQLFLLRQICDKFSVVVMSKP